MVFDEPLGPWDGTYKGTASPYGETVELFDEQNNSIMVSYQTLPNGDVISCGGAMIKLRIYGRGRVVLSLTRMVGDTKYPPRDALGYISNGIASGFENNGTWFGALSRSGSESNLAIGEWADEYGCKGNWEVISLTSFTNCTSESNSTSNNTTLGASNQTGNNTTETSGNGTTETACKPCESGSLRDFDAGWFSEFECLLGLMPEPMKTIPKAMMGEPFESEPLHAGKTGETAVPSRHYRWSGGG